MRVLMTSGAAMLAFAGAAHAATIYDFTFTNVAQLEGEGTFTTGAASGTDAGYFLLTGLTFTALRDTGGTLNTGSLLQTAFEPGSAYDPTTEAFINHYAGNTYTDYGGGFVIGSTTPNDFDGAEVDSDSFSRGGSDNGLGVDGDPFQVSSYALLTITPAATVPEPPAIAVLATGLLGLLGWRTRRL